LVGVLSARQGHLRAASRLSAHALGLSYPSNHYIRYSCGGHRLRNQHLRRAGIGLQVSAVSIQPPDKLGVVGDVGSMRKVDQHSSTRHVAYPLLHAYRLLPIASTTPITDHVALVARKWTHNRNRS